MHISRQAMTAILNLAKADLSTQTPEAREQIATKIRRVYDQLPQVTTIEGVKKLPGAKYLIETACVDILDTLGEPVDELTIAKRHTAAFLDVTLP